MSHTFHRTGDRFGLRQSTIRWQDRQDQVSFGHAGVNGLHVLDPGAFSQGAGMGTAP